MIRKYTIYIYFSTLSDAFDIAALKCEKPCDTAKMRTDMENCIKLMDGFKSTIEKCKNAENEDFFQPAVDAWNYINVMYSRIKVGTVKA